MVSSMIWMPLHFADFLSFLFVVHCCFFGGTQYGIAGAAPISARVPDEDILTNCNVEWTRARLEDMLQENPDHHVQILALLDGGPSAVRTLCCQRGWKGDGATGYPGEGGLCWPLAGNTPFEAYARCCHFSLRLLAESPMPRWMDQDWDWKG
mmetsp:Transcript_73466/g.160899  ORF Transcript_73466/g.160899 Transcript_73466/m.160899 type:complete len:152 (-) Transcript_73466:79-534(-)